MAASIYDVLHKIKRNEREAFFIFLIILLMLLSYGLGRLSKIEEGREPVRIVPRAGGAFESGVTTGGISADAFAQSGLLTGSRNGSVYHLPWCPGAQRIKEENKVWFEDAREAKQRGYRAAKNCPGIDE